MNDDLISKIYNHISYMDSEAISKFLSKYQDIAFYVGAFTVFIDSYCCPIYIFSLLFPRLFRKDYQNNQREMDFKEPKEIYDLYQKFLEEYKKMNNTFDFSNPVEIYTLYNYLLKRGYLSKDKTHNYANNHDNELFSLLGAKVFTGKSVCRHNAKMLSDIYTKMEINCYSICGNNSFPKLKYDFVTKQNTEAQIKDLYQLVNQYSFNAEEKEELYGLIELFGKNLKIDVNISHQDKKINHCMNMIEDNSKIYYYDPTNDFIMEKKDDYLLSNNHYCTFKICDDIYKWMNYKKDYKLYKNCFEMPCASIDECEDIRKKAQKTCTENTDIFDKFYNDNKDLYSEISSKMKKLTR